MNFFKKICILLKRMRGYPTFLQKEQCGGKIVYGDISYFCVKDAGHFGMCRTYNGKRF
tara:strand:- start:455 stop:628 length:174 start_codon:yes stop_codon:yes gene_type:complete